jgi:ribosomal protein L37E
MEQSITCPNCHRTSYHPKDVEHRFCGVCGFHDQLPNRSVVTMEQAFNFTDGAGRRVRATINIVDLQKAALTLAQRARSTGRNTATALDGSIRVTVEPVA